MASILVNANPQSYATALWSSEFNARLMQDVALVGSVALLALLALRRCLAGHIII